MTAPSSDGRRAGGFTVIELSIVMAIATAIMASLLAVLTSQSNAAGRVEHFVDKQEAVRLVLVALQRDLRSSAALVELAPEVDRSSRVDLEVYDSPDAAESTLVRWRVLPTKELVREVVQPGGAVQVTVALSDVSLPTDGLFAYFGAHGSAPLSQAETPGTIASCTVRVRIDLAAATTDAGPAPVRLVSEVQLRNRLQGRSGC